jgi:hypothetical protein
LPNERQPLYLMRREGHCLALTSASLARDRQALGLPLDRAALASVGVSGNVADAFCIFHFEGDVNGQRERFIAGGRESVNRRHKNWTWKAIYHYESNSGHRLMTNEE